MEIEGLEQVRVEALNLVRRLLDAQPDTFWNGQDWTLEVADERGCILYTLALS